MIIVSLLYRSRSHQGQGHCKVKSSLTVQDCNSLTVHQRADGKAVSGVSLTVCILLLLFGFLLLLHHCFSSFLASSFPTVLCSTSLWSVSQYFFCLSCLPVWLSLCSMIYVTFFCCFHSLSSFLAVVKFLHFCLSFSCPCFPFSSFFLSSPCFPFSLHAWREQ